MTPRPDEYALVCRDCEPEWSDPTSSAVYRFPTMADLEEWTTEHQRDTSHSAFWSAQAQPHADQTQDQDQGVRYMQACLLCHPEYAGSAEPRLDMDASATWAVTVWATATDCIEAAFTHHESTGHTAFRTELVVPSGKRL